MNVHRFGVIICFLYYIVLFLVKIWLNSLFLGNHSLEENYNIITL